MVRLLGCWSLATALQATVAFAGAPYVVTGPTGPEAWSVVDGQVRKEPVSTGESLTIPAADNRPAFCVTLRPPAATAADELPWPQRVPVFVLADSHGEFEIATQLLHKHGVIDSSLRWSFGPGRLVILGDVFDRGAFQTELLWLFYELESEAGSAGGAVHFLLGNHETMVLTGDVRYTNAKYTEEAKLLGVDVPKLWSKETLLGRWLRTKPAMLKIGTVLFAHGGPSRDMVEAKLTIPQINATVQAWLEGRLSKNDPKLLIARGQTGPLWYRALVRQEASVEDIDAIKSFYDVDRIAVGHTIVPTVTSLYGNSVIAVQVYPTRDQATGRMNMEGVLIDATGTWRRAKIDGTTEPLFSNSAGPRQSSPVTP